MLQNTCLIYELLYIFKETRARCVLVGDGHDWLRGETYKRLVNGPARPRRERSRCAPESSAKSSVLNSEPWLRQCQAEIIAHCDVWELHLNIRTYRYQIEVGAAAAVLGRKVGTRGKFWTIIFRIQNTHTWPSDLGGGGTQPIQKIVCQHNSGSEYDKLW